MLRLFRTLQGTHVGGSEFSMKSLALGISYLEDYGNVIQKVGAGLSCMDSSHNLNSVYSPPIS